MRHDRLGLNNISLQDAAAFWEMQLLPNDCLPAIATHALAEGYDSPSLRRLAGETETLASTLGPLFTKALTELGVATPDTPSAQMAVAKHYARRILDDSIPPYEGARLIWWNVANHACLDKAETEVWDRLSIFVGLASEYEDYPPARKQHEDEIIKAARDLLADCQAA